jgi:hypothetical protein
MMAEWGWREPRQVLAQDFREQRGALPEATREEA